MDPLKPSYMRMMSLASWNIKFSAVINSLTFVLVTFAYARLVGDGDKYLALGFYFLALGGGLMLMSAALLINMIATTVSASRAIRLGRSDGWHSTRSVVGMVLVIIGSLGFNIWMALLGGHIQFVQVFAILVLAGAILEHSGAKQNRPRQEMAVG